jgi:hypothetical protein
LADSSGPDRNADGTWRPGVVANPQGKNQWDYRRAFEDAITRLMRGEITTELLEFVPEYMRPLVSEDMEMGEFIALQQAVRTLQGDEKAVSESLARIWPKVDRHELTGRDGGAMEVASEGGWAELSGRLAVVRRRSEGPDSDREPEPDPPTGRLQ